MALISGGKTYSSGREYSTALKEKKQTPATIPAPSTTPLDRVRALAAGGNSAAVAYLKNNNLGTGGAIGGEWGVLDDAEAVRAGLPTTGFESTVPTGAGGVPPQNLRQAMGGSAGRVAGVAPVYAAGARPNKQSTVAGQTANSAGAYYGSAGRDTTGLTIDGVDRTAGIGNDPMSAFMEMFSPTSVTDRTKTVRREIERERQGQIDAINAKYEKQAADREKQGQEDLARMRSMNLRAGLGGSDFGAANKEQVRQGTRADIRGIQANQDLAVGNVISEIDNLANQRIQMEQSAAQQGFSNAMQYAQYTQSMQQQQRQEAVSRIAELGKAGLDLPAIKERDPQLYDSLTAASGMSDIELEAVMNNNKPAPQRVDYQYKVVGGKIIAYGIDPTTGTLKTLEQEVDIPDNYSISTMPDGTVLAVPDNWNGDTSLIRTVGNYAKPTGGGTSVATGSTAPIVGLVDASGKPIKLTATQTDALAGYDNTVQASQDALALLQSGVQTGPVAGRMMAIGKFTGNVDQNQLKLEQLLGKIKADFMKAMSGAAVSEQEVQRLSKFLPDMTDQEPVIASKLNTLQQEVARSKENLLNTLGAVQQSTAEVEVRSPDGTIGTIPADQLQQALAEGYTQV